MKFKFYSIKSDYESTENGDVFAILNWNWIYTPMFFEYKNRGFTGNCCKSFYFSFELFRKKYFIILDWNHLLVSPEEAKRLYHKRFKN